MDPRCATWCRSPTASPVRRIVSCATGDPALTTASKPDHRSRPTLRTGLHGDRLLTGRGLKRSSLGLLGTHRLLAPALSCSRSTIDHSIGLTSTPRCCKNPDRVGGRPHPTLSMSLRPASMQQNPATQCQMSAGQYSGAAFNAHLQDCLQGANGGNLPYMAKTSAGPEASLKEARTR